MATTLPPTAAPLTSRTTPQPAVALGQAPRGTSAASDKDSGDLLGLKDFKDLKDFRDLKRTEAVSKPPEAASKTPEPAAQPADRLPRTPTPPRVNREPDARDWGLAPAEPRTSWKAKAGWASAALALAVIGYFSYTTFLAAPSAAAHQDDSEGQVAEQESDESVEAEAELADPFETAPLITPRSSFAKSAPRAVRHAEDARPAGSPPAATADRAPRNRRQSVRDEPTLELPDHDDELPDVSSVEQSEPTADEISAPPVLRPTPGPALDTGRNNRSTPPIQVGAASAEELDGFELDDEPRSASTGGGVSNSETDADELEGFEPDELASRRAVSRTVVTSAAAAPRAQSNVGPGRFEYRSGNESEHEDASFSARTPGRASGAPATVSNPPRGDRGASGMTTPHADVYTVAPNDNFWTISRKVYGTSRYYAALTRHNADRIPDPQRLRPGMPVATPSAAVLEQSYPDLIEKSARAASPAPAQAVDAGDGRPWFGPPDAARNAPRAPRETEKSGAAGYFYGRSGQPLYRIGPDDTLGSIAQKHLGRFSRWNEVYEQNRDVLKSPDNLTVGTVIRLPHDASRLSLVPEAERRR